MSSSKDSQQTEEKPDIAQKDQDEETSSEQLASMFSENKKHYAMFYLIDIPDGYVAEMRSGIVHDVTPWVAISSKSSTNAIQEIKANLAAEKESPQPFLNSTVEEAYEFFKNHLRPADDDPRGSWHTFSYFTFLAVDADCIKSEPWQCIVCCDAPDYGESHSETRLKQLRLPVTRALEGLNLVEELLQTPSEFVNKPDFMLGMVPPGWMVEVHNDRGERLGHRVWASPGEARAKKGHSIWKLEQQARQQKAEEESAARGEL